MDDDFIEQKYDYDILVPPKEDNLNVSKYLKENNMLTNLDVNWEEIQTFNRLSDSDLSKMELPNIPSDVQDILSINWCGRMPNIPSAIFARCDKNHIPLVEIHFKYGNITEEYSYFLALKEIALFIEVAREVKGLYGSEQKVA